MCKIPICMLFNRHQKINPQHVYNYSTHTRYEIYLESKAEEVSSNRQAKRYTSIKQRYSSFVRSLDSFVALVSCGRGYIPRRLGSESWRSRRVLTDGASLYPSWNTTVRIGEIYWPVPRFDRNRYTPSAHSEEKIDFRYGLVQHTQLTGTISWLYR